MVTQVFAHTQADLALDGVDADDLGMELVAHADHFFRLLHAVIGELAHVDEPFNAVFEPGKRAEADQLGHLDLGMRTDRQSLDYREPRVVLELLVAHADLLVVGVDAEHLDLDLLPLLEHLRGMVDLLGPRHVGDMQQAVNAFLELHEGAVVREVAHNALDRRTDGVALPNLFPRVGLGLLEAQGNLLRVGIDAEDHDGDFVVNLE